MINLLKAELYKLQKSRSFWVSGGLIVLFAVSIYLFYVLLRDGMINGMDQEGAVIQGELPALGILDILRQIFANRNAVIFATIFVSLFVLGDYRSGAVKNFEGKGLRRDEIYLAKFLVTELGAVLLYLMAALAVFLGGIVFFGTEQINGGFFRSFLSYLSLQLLYLTGYTAVIVLICEMTRNTAGLLISVLGILMFSSVLLQGVDLILDTLGVSFSISRYWVMTAMDRCPVTDISRQFIMESGLVAAGWLVVSLGAGMVYHMRKDIV